jgi:phosphoribosylformylglycinamidine synthase
VKIGVIVFPGSNCDYDAYQAFKQADNVDLVYLWHGSRDLENCDIVVLPGGFSYGDYLRAGAIARFSPIMKKVVEFARGGGFVLGICNGFQILLEASLLPGAMMRNAGLRFVCREVWLRVETNQTRLTAKMQVGQLLRMPVAHAEGNYYADPRTLAELESKGRVVFRYADSAAVVSASANPNGSLNGIAGITNENANVIGMMPHPERAAEAILGSTDGLDLIKSLCFSDGGGSGER